MKPSLLLQEILNCWNADLIPMLIGSPGGGKSDLVRQAAKKRAELMGLDFDDNVDTYIDNHASPEKIFGYIDFRTTSRDPIDMSGGLDMSGEFTRYKSPGYLPHAKVHGKVGTIMFDEANRAAPSMQNCLIEVFLDRKVGGYRLPPDWRLAAAGNSANDGAYVTKMDGALSDRVVYYDFDTDLDDWTKWAANNGVAPEVMAFCRFRPELLHQFDKNQRSNPTPRSWASVSAYLAHSSGGPGEHATLCGIVGEGAAIELTAFLKIFRTLPSPDAILLDPKGAEVPSEPAVMYALCGALARKASKDNFDRVVTYLARLPAEFSVMAVRDSINHNSEVQTTKAFIQWASDNSNVLI